MKIVDLAGYEPLQESVEMLVTRLTRIAQQCETVEKFIRKTDGEDVLYRGHSAEQTGDNSFMTDYVGHAAEYAEEGRIDAFGYDPSDVLYFDDAQFNGMRTAYRQLSDKQLAAIYQAPFAKDRFANAMINGGLRSTSQVLARVKRALRGGTPYSSISGDSTTNDLLIPLLQMYAHQHGKNIIAFHGSDYAEYGGQTEFVVADVSKLINLRDLYAKVT